MSAVLFLDIDGVLNPYKATNPHKHLAGYSKFPFTDGGLTTRAWVSKEHGRRLSRLSLQVVWATTWIWYPDMLEQYALLSGLPGDLPTIQFDVPVDDDWNPYGGNCGKRPGLVKYLAEHPEVDRVVWADDMLGGGDWEWAGSLPYKSLALKPHPAVGLSNKTYDQIEEFLG